MSWDLKCISWTHCSRHRLGPLEQSPLNPFVTVTGRLREWFEAEPWRTSRELFERLQEEQPDIFPDGQLRTLQRRLKEWRREVAHQMVFGSATTRETPVPGPVSPNT